MLRSCTMLSLVGLLTLPTLWSGSQPALRSEPQPPAKTGPVVADYGPVYAVPDPDFETPMDRDLKAVFDVARAPSETDRVNPSIETVARYLNMHAGAGVSRSGLQAALVLHGGAGKYALSHAAYRDRFGTENPSLKLIADLNASGVRVILCGQTAASRLRAGAIGRAGGARALGHDGARGAPAGGLRAHRFLSEGKAERPPNERRTS